MTRQHILGLLAALALLAACDTTGNPTDTPIPAFTNPATPRAATTSEPGDSIGGTTYPLPVDQAEPDLEPGAYPTQDMNLRPDPAYPTPTQ